jgi:hypothetical protein
VGLCTMRVMNSWMIMTDATIKSCIWLGFLGTYNFGFEESGCYISISIDLLLFLRSRGQRVQSPFLVTIETDITKDNQILGHR